MRKGFALLAIGFAAVYIGTWIAFGEQVMLDENVERIWTDWDLQNYAADAPLYLCTDLTEGGSVTLMGRTAQVVSRKECELSTVRDSLQRAVETIPPDSASGIVLAYATADVQTPLLTRNGVAYWFYGTDHVKACDEWATWALFRWVVLYEANGPECTLLERRDVYPHISP